MEILSAQSVPKGPDADKRLVAKHPSFAEKRDSGDPISSREFDLKSALFVTVTGAILLVSASITNGQDMRRRAQPSARATLQDDANVSAQSSTNMSYGEIVATRSEDGAPPRPTPCAYARQCSLFSKH
jgi:hypothetical protein